jgi:cation transport ATPase
VEWFPSLTFRARFEKVQRFARHRAFHRLIVVVVVTHLMLIITESAQVLSGHDVDNIGWTVAEWFYTIAYIAECILKLLTSGWYRYWSRHHNKLALLLTAANLAANILNVYQPVCFSLASFTIGKDPPSQSENQYIV